MESHSNKTERAASLFDIRRVIGALFVVYGVTLTITGAVASHADIQKAAGVNINLWTGLGMIAFGASFIAWFVLRPVRLEEGQETQEAELVEQHQREAREARSEEARRRARFDRERAHREIGAGRE